MADGLLVKGNWVRLLPRLGGALNVPPDDDILASL